MRTVAGALLAGLAVGALVAAAAQPSTPGEGAAAGGLDQTEPLGVLEPVARAMLGAPTYGTIMEILVEEGQEVKEGQVLVQLDDRGRKLEYDRAKISAENQSDVEQARLTAEFRSLEYERQKKVHESLKASTISESELETYRLNSELAQVTYEMRQADLALREVVVELRSYELEITRVRAPFAGVITRKVSEVGQVAELATPLLELIDTHQLYFVVDLPVARLRDVSVGQEVLVTPELFPELARRGRVVLVGPEVTVDTVRVKVLVDNADGRLRSGFFARVALPPGDAKAEGRRSPGQQRPSPSAAGGARP